MKVREVEVEYKCNNSKSKMLHCPKEGVGDVATGSLSQHISIKKSEQSEWMSQGQSDSLNTPSQTKGVLLRELSYQEAWMSKLKDLELATWAKK